MIKALAILSLVAMSACKPSRPSASPSGLDAGRDTSIAANHSNTVCPSACCTDAAPPTCPRAVTGSMQEADDIAIRDFVTTLIHLAPGEKAADIGASRGFHTCKMAAMVGDTGRVYATDIDPNAIASLRTLASQPPYTNVEPRSVDKPRATGLEDLPEGSLSAVLMVNSVTFEHAHGTVAYRDDDRVYLESIAKRMRKGGQFIYHLDWRNDYVLTRNEMVELFRAAGFADVKDVAFPSTLPDEVCGCTRTQSAEHWKRGYLLVFTR